MIGFRTILQGQRAIVWNAAGRVRYVDGPRRLFLFRERLEPMHRFAAEPGQYLVVRRRDGTTENISGPAAIWLDPVEHQEVAVAAATKVDANEALVVYRRTGDKVQRRIVRGPALFTPDAEEWIHEFSWHGNEPKHGHRKVPFALNFTKLRVIPDQMYFDVENVRTADDALLVVKVMLFFELGDIEKMLDQTHDPIADFINALSADVVDLVGGHTFEAFKGQTEALNRLETFPQLVQRAERIGYRINKVVYRGYYASDKLQVMHDAAIECRTKLRLEAETESQTQQLADLRLTREQERSEKRRQMEEADARHTNALKQLDNDAELQRLETRNKQALEVKRREEQLVIEFRREQDALALAQEKAKHEEQTAYFTRMKDLQVDLTRYLVARYQNPDKLIRIDAARQPQLHLHEE